MDEIPPRPMEGETHPNLTALTLSEEEISLMPDSLRADIQADVNMWLLTYVKENAVTDDEVVFGIREIIKDRAHHVRHIHHNHRNNEPAP